MENTKNASNAAGQAENIQAYYKLHAKIYDATRWTFLLGRNDILRKLPTPAPGATLLEVGCGTGRNLRKLAAMYPELYLIGVDVSSDMLQRAGRATQDLSRRVLLFEKPYAPGTFKLEKPVDIVMCSYALTMFNPGWEAAIDRAYADLKEGGYMAVVDFHSSPSSGFRWWMGQNHVRMEGHLLPYLRQKFTDHYVSVRPAYLGLWKYLVYIGQK